jgi:hypothetical protein
MPTATIILCAFFFALGILCTLHAKQEGKPVMPSIWTTPFNSPPPPIAEPVDPPPQSAQDVLAQLQEKWTGTEIELLDALRAFYNDLREQVPTSNAGDEIIAGLDDYVDTAYFIGDPS